MHTFMHNDIYAYCETHIASRCEENRAFQMGYKEGDRIFYVSTTNNKGVKEYVTPMLMTSWDIYWQIKNARFEEHF
jgi:hypothetical protein